MADKEKGGVRQRLVFAEIEKRAQQVEEAANIVQQRRLQVQRDVLSDAQLSTFAGADIELADGTVFVVNRDRYGPSGSLDELSETLSQLLEIQRIYASVQSSRQAQFSNLQDVVQHFENVQRLAELVCGGSKCLDIGLDLTGITYDDLQSAETGSLPLFEAAVTQEIQKRDSENRALQQTVVENPQEISQGTRDALNRTSRYGEAGASSNQELLQIADVIGLVLRKEMTPLQPSNNFIERATSYGFQKEHLDELIVIPDDLDMMMDTTS